MAVGVELETNRPRGQDGPRQDDPAVLLAKAESALSEQHRVSDAEKATLELRANFATEKLSDLKESLAKVENRCASLDEKLSMALEREAKETTHTAGLRLTVEKDAAVHAALIEASAAKLAASEARVAALQAQFESAQAGGWPASGSDSSAAVPVLPCYRVDDGGAVAFRKSPASEDRSAKAAEAGMLINEVGRVIKADGEVWVQHSNELWLPLAFLEPFQQPVAAADSAPELELRPEPEPEPEPEVVANPLMRTSAPADPEPADPLGAVGDSSAVAAMVAKINSPAKAKLTKSTTEVEGSKAWGDGGSAALARVAVRASAAECEAQRSRADAAGKEIERLVATVAELKASLRQSKRSADEADSARQTLSKTVAKLEGETAVYNERSISARRLMEEEKSHAAVLAAQAKRAEERVGEMSSELTDARMMLSAQQTRAVTTAAELLAAEEAAQTATSTMAQKITEVEKRCQLAVQRGDELLTLQELAAASGNGGHHIPTLVAERPGAGVAAPAPAPAPAPAAVVSSGNGGGASSAALAAAEIKAADQERVIDALQDELRWHRRQQGRIERAVRICIKRTWRHSLAWWAFAVWRQSETLSGDEPAYAQSESVAASVAASVEAAAREQLKANSESTTAA